MTPQAESELLFKNQHVVGFSCSFSDHRIPHCGQMTSFFGVRRHEIDLAGHNSGFDLTDPKRRADPFAITSVLDQLQRRRLWHVRT